MTGFHLAGVTSAAITHEPPLAVVSFSQDEEQESAAVGVEVSYARQIAWDVQDHPLLVAILTVFGGAVLIQCFISVLREFGTHRAGRPYFRAGFPPLPHAPPALRS